MSTWKDTVAQDSDGLYNAQALINDLIQALPLVNISTMQLAKDVVGGTTDWLNVNYNEYYLFNSLQGKNAPDKEKMILDKGLMFKFGSKDAWVQVALTQNAIGVRYDDSTSWSYVNGSGGGSDNSSYVVDNKDGTVYFNGVTVTLATSKDIDAINKTLGIKQDKLAYTPADDSKVVHTTDMRKPASEVVSLDELNNKQDKLAYTPANDTNVVHLTQDEEIAGKKTFDNPPIDKTSGKAFLLPADLTKLIQPSSKNDEDSAVSDSTSDKSNFYYWTE